MSALYENLFGSKIDFTLSISGDCEKKLVVEADGSNNDEHMKLLTEICEEPTKMLAHFHQVHDDLIGAEMESKITRADELRREGNDKHSAGRFEEALTCYKEAIKLTPNDAKLYSNSCLCNMALRRFEEAVVDAQACLFADISWTKCFGMFMCAYCHLGYMDIVQNYMRHGTTDYGPNFFNEATKKVTSITKSGSFSSRRSMDRHDLEATLCRLFQGNHPPRTYAFMLTHIVQHCEWDDNGGDTEEFLESQDFLRRVFAVPYFKRIFDPNQDFSTLSVEDAIVMCLLLRLAGSVIICNNNTAILPVIVSFMASLGQFWTKESTLKLVAEQKFPFGPMIFEYFCRMLHTFAVNKSVRTRIYKSTPPFNRPDWLLRLPAVSFGLLNPVKAADVYFAVVRLVCIVATQTWFSDLLAKAPPSELSQAIGLFASFGIVCGRLLDYELPHETGDLPEIDETVFMIWMKLSESKEFIKLAVTNPNVWMLFARRLSKDPNYDPSENGFPLIALRNLLSPWAWETDEKTDNVCIENGPWFDMLLYSLPRLMLPRREFLETIVSAVNVGARLATANKNFAKKLSSLIPLARFNTFHNRGVDDSGAIHFFAAMLDVVDDEAIRQFVVETEKRFKFAMVTVIFALSNAESDFYDSMFDAEIYHACVCIYRLLKCASRIEATDRECAEKIRTEVVDELNKTFDDLQSLFNALVSWVKRPQKETTGSKKDAGQKGGAKGGANKGRKNNKNKGRMAQRRSNNDSDEDDNDEDEVVPTEISSPAVHKLFDALSAVDNEMAMILQKVKAKRRF